MEIIIIFAILGIIASIVEDPQPKCYKGYDNNCTCCCTGDGCDYKFSCKAYKNYIEDE